MTLQSMYSFPPQNAPEGGQGREEGTEKTAGFTDFGGSLVTTRERTERFSPENGDWSSKNAVNSQGGCENFQSRRSAM